MSERGKRIIDWELFIMSIVLFVTTVHPVALFTMVVLGYNALWQPLKK